MTVIGLDHIQMTCPSGGEDVARAFWGGVLGLEEVEKPQELRSRGGCWFRMGTVGLHVGVEEPLVPATKAHPALRVGSVPELEALAERLEAAGHAVEWAAVPIAEARLKTHDPFGNLVELLVGTTG